MRELSNEEMVEVCGAGASCRAPEGPFQGALDGGKAHFWDNWWECQDGVWIWLY